MEDILQVLGHIGVKQVLLLVIFMMVQDVNLILYHHAHIMSMVLIQLALHQLLQLQLVLHHVKLVIILLIAKINILEKPHTVLPKMLLKFNKKL